MTLTSDLVFRIIVSGTYLILFEMGIPSLVCGCILGWWSVVYHLWVTVNLSLTLPSFHNNHGRSISYINLGRNPKIWSVDSSCNGGLVHTILGFFDLDFRPHF